MLDSNYKCIFGTSWKIDCAQLKDEKWHHILMRKDDYGDSYFYLDGALLDRSSGVFIDRSITLGGTIGVSTFVGKIGAFRIYRGNLNQTGMDALYDEFPLLHAGIVVDPQKPIITIAEPSTDSASFKKITATANLGTLEMYVQDPTITSPVCDSSVSNSKFEAYSQLLFNNATDNGTRICYRATNGANVTYKFSNRIYGISTESAIISTENIFSDNAYLAWPSSRKKNPADFMFNIIDRIASQGVSFVDINGDGLIDTLYADNFYKALLVNNGDYTFRVAYKCYFNPVTKDYYYGDCANTNYKN